MENSEEALEKYRLNLIEKLKKQSHWEETQELGRMLMRNIDSFTPDELKRYNELLEILKPEQ